MRAWLSRFSRWMPLLVAISVPAASWARIGGGQHYRSTPGGSNRSYGSHSTPSSGDHSFTSPSTPSGGGDLGGVVFYLVAVTFRHPGLMCPLWVAAGLVLY